MRTATSWRSASSPMLASAMVAAALWGVTSSASAGPGAGCDPLRPAVAHRADAELVTVEHQRVPCGTETGHYTGETTIGVTDDGMVWFSAADWEWALVRSGDQGATWEKFTVPGPQAYPGCPGSSSAIAECSDSQQDKYNTVADAFLWVDPSTSRLFWTKTYGYALCASMNHSSDGEHWTPVSRWGCPGGDYEKIAGGPPPAGGSTPTTDYPNILYGCTNGPAPTFVVGPSRVCYKSIDGGDTWTATGAPVTPSPLAPGCLHFQESHKVGPDGTLYLPLGCALDPNRVMLAWSDDEAMTWNYAEVPIGEAANQADLIGGVSLGVDLAGTVHLVWVATDGHVHLASTADRGASWVGPLDVTMPGVTIANPKPQIEAREPGHVAIAYYGHTGDATLLNGYLTETFAAGTDDPVFQSAQLNGDDDPLYFPTNGGTLPRNDYLGVTIGPDGTPWTALVKLRSAEPDEEGFVQSTGFAGRLAWAGAPPTTSSPAARVVGAAPAAASWGATRALPVTGGGVAGASIAAILVANRFRSRPRRSP